MSIAEKRYWTEGIKEGRNLERERIIELLIQETGHNGKTHYEGINCQMCKLIELIEKGTDD